MHFDFDIRLFRGTSYFKTLVRQLSETGQKYSFILG